MLADELRVMRVDKLTRQPLLTRRSPQLRRRAVTQLHYYFVLAVEERDHAVQVRDKHQIATQVEVAGAAHAFGDELDVLAVQGEVLEAVVGAVGNHEERLFASRIHPDTMRLKHLARLFALAAEGADVLAVQAELVNPVGAVAVGDIEVAIGREGDVGGDEGLVIRIKLGSLRRQPLFPNDFPIELCFYKLAVGGVAVIEILFIPLAPQIKPVRTTAEARSPGGDELAGPVKDNNGVTGRTAGMDGVGDIDIAAGVFGDALGIAPLDMLRRLQPIVDALVGMLAASQQQATPRLCCLFFAHGCCQSGDRHRRAGSRLQELPARARATVFF